MPYLPDWTAAISAARPALLRCWVPCCTMRLCLRAASTQRRPSLTLWLKDVYVAKRMSSPDVHGDAIRSLSISQRLLGTEDVVIVMHEGCGLHGASEDAFAEQLRADGVLPTWRLGAFTDVEATLRDSLTRLRASAELPHRDHIRGFVFNPEDGTLREVA